MASDNLIIDDDYCKKMGTYFKRQGEQMDKLVADYIAILKDVRKKAIVSGEISKTLDVYIMYVQEMNKQIGDISDTAKKKTNVFLNKVDAADQYKF